jgi:UPF0755 protein
MIKRIFIFIVLLLLVAGGWMAWNFFGPTLSVPTGKYFYIRTGSDYATVKKALLDKKIVTNEFYFSKLAALLHYPNAVKAGRYEIKKGMSLYQLLKMLRSGNQSPVNLVINKIRLKEDLAAKIAANFECDSLSVINFLNNDDSAQTYHLNSNTLLSAIIPNTYSIFWNASPSRIFRKLYTEQENSGQPSASKKQQR